VVLQAVSISDFLLSSGNRDGEHLLTYKNKCLKLFLVESGREYRVLQNTARDVKRNSYYVKTVAYLSHSAPVLFKSINFLNTSAVVKFNKQNPQRPSLRAVYQFPHLLHAAESFLRS
jgi:hypothetical protein